MGRSSRVANRPRSAVCALRPPAHLQPYRLTNLFTDQVRNQLVKSSAIGRQHERGLSLVPIQFEALHARRNPYLADGRVRTHNEFCRRILEFNRKGALVTIHIKFMIVGRPLQSALQPRQSFVGGRMELPFIEHVLIIADCEW
jgi:hypothetical protein